MLAAIVAARAWAEPTLGGPMSHLLVTVHQQTVYLTLESPDMATVVMQEGAGYTGPASVLNGTGYNAQFGWLANGFISLPPGAGMFVRTVSSSPWISVYSESGFAPILGTGGSSPLWQWNGTMVHNWYATRVHGGHTVTHEVFVGDQSGSPLAGWTPGVIDLRFVYGSAPPIEPFDRDAIRHGVIRPGGGPAWPVPAPSALGVLGVFAVIGRRRGR